MIHRPIPPPLGRAGQRANEGRVQVRVLKQLMTHAVIQSPHPNCMGGLGVGKSLTASRIVILVVIVVVVTTMIAMGSEPEVAVGIAGACGFVAAEVAGRLLGPLRHSRSAAG